MRVKLWQLASQDPDHHYASDRGRWITGTTMPIDGGMLAGRNAPPAPVTDAVASPPRGVVAVDSARLRGRLFLPVPA
jgi:hypothetical protein